MSKGTIGSMTAVVRATSSKFSKDIDAIRGDVRGLKGTMAQPVPSGGMFASFGAGGAIGAGIVAAQAGIRALTGTVRKFFDTISELENLGDFANQIGATAEEIQGLRFAAQQGGSSAEAMDKALEKMVVRIGEARGGAKETQDAFAALGTNVDELANMSAGDALKTLAEGFKNISNPADQAALATDIFGRSSLDLVNVLNQGADGIDEMIDRGRELGAVLSNEDVAAAGEASLAIKEMKTAWKALWTQLTVAVLPALKFVVEGITEVVAWMNNLISAVRKALEWLGLLEKNTSEGFEAPTTGGSSALQNVLDEQKATQEAAAEQKKAAADAQKAVDDMMKRGEQVAKSLRAPFEVFNDTLDDMARLLDVGAINWKVYERAVRQAADTLDKATLSKEKAERFQPTQAIGAAMRGTSEGFSAVQSAQRQRDNAERKAEKDRADQLEETKKSNRSLKLIEEALSRGRSVQRAAEL